MANLDKDVWKAIVSDELSFSVAQHKPIRYEMDMPFFEKVISNPKIHKWMLDRGPYLRQWSPGTLGARGVMFQLTTDAWRHLREMTPELPATRSGPPDDAANILLCGGMGKKVITEYARISIPGNGHDRIVFKLTWECPNGKMIGRDIRMLSIGPYRKLFKPYEKKIIVVPGLGRVNGIVVPSVSAALLSGDMDKKDVLNDPSPF